MRINIESNKEKVTGKRNYRDISLWLLVLSNLYTLYLTIEQGLDFKTVMLIYWVQSVIIGIFAFIKIISAKIFITGGLKINGRKAEATNGTKRFVAFFFLFHYGFFHLGYLMFINTSSFVAPPLKIDLGLVLWVSLIFLVNHAFSFIYNFQRDREQEKNIGKMMFAPYARIVPMHLIIVFGGMFFLYDQVPTIVAFFLIKTAVDAFMHAGEHRILNKEGSA